MRLILIIVATAILAGVASPAAAQAIVTVEQAQAATERGAAISAATRRTTEILTGVTGDPQIGSAADPYSLAAAIERRTVELRGSIQELRALHRSLSALPSIEGAAGSPVLRAVDQSVDDTAALAQRGAVMLEQLLVIPQAVRSGDQAAYERAYKALGTSAILFSEFRASGLRTQAATEDHRPALNQQLLSMACFADGEAAVQGALLDPADRAAAIVKTAAAEACMRDHIARGRESLLSERPDDPRIQNVLAALGPIDAAMFDAIGDAADWLAEANAALKRRDAAIEISARMNPVYRTIMFRLQELGTQQRQAIADANF